MSIRVFWATVCLLNVLCAVGHAQIPSSFTRVYGSEDQVIPLPLQNEASGREDIGALQEIVNYLKAVQVGSWKGLQGSGSFSRDGKEIAKASLAILGSDYYRLDLQSGDGITSTRISGNSGFVSETDGKRTQLPASTVRLGIMVFPRIFQDSFPSPATGLIDDGTVQIAGQVLHRITVSEEIAPGERTSVDLYFEQGSHLLVKSAALSRIDARDPNQYFIVTSYEDYRKVEGALIPHRYTETINGQLQWRLQMTDVSLAPNVDNAYFQF